MKKGGVIIGGKLYSPEASTAICEAVGMFETTTLYKSRSGAYFTITESPDPTARAAAELAEREALDFIAAHPLGVITENYIKAFGEPAEG